MTDLLFPELRDLTDDAWRALAAGEIAGLIIPGWASEDECARCAKAARLRQLGEVSPRRRTGYQLPPSIGYAAGGPECLQHYLATAQATVDATRAAFEGGVSPMDRFFLRLMDLHPPGVRVPRLKAQCYASQHIRMWTAQARTPPHIDAWTTSALDFGITKRLAVNIYAHVTNDVSGALELYGRTDDPGCGVGQRLAAGTSGVPLGQMDLGMPVKVIHPQRGAAIVFDAGAIVHGVSALAEGESRVTLAAFVGIVAPDQPLLVFA